MSASPARRRFTAALALALPLTALSALAACSDDSPSSAATSETQAPDSDRDAVTVAIARSRFPAQPTTVAAGGTVSFENTDPFAHTVTSADGSAMTFDSGEMSESQTFDVTFEQPGEFSYFCEIHPTMVGTVVVEAG